MIPLVFASRQGNIRQPVLRISSRGCLQMSCMLGEESRLSILIIIIEFLFSCQSMSFPSYS
ncbi:hypothetical protein MUK42_16941 [Musa troglodytarum]|uniref:Uncharacterized protein n=1 Tax=Musa troglodytarum TaxID=320322 RepID=A0A9E7HKZ4_9LILI|nr:hypothetical protein MUK42_16941 [Musa troglodytarum]